MKHTLSAALVGAALLAASQGAFARDLVKIDGSSTVFPITEAMAEEFQIAEKGKTMVTVGISGTGGGFKSSVVVRRTFRMPLDQLRILSANCVPKTVLSLSNCQQHLMR